MKQCSWAVCISLRTRSSLASPAIVIRGRSVTSVICTGWRSSGIRPSASSTYSTTSMRAFEARWRNHRSWQDDAAITTSCSGLRTDGSPWPSPVVSRTSCSAGGAFTPCSRP